MLKQEWAFSHKNNVYFNRVYFKIEFGDSGFSCKKLMRRVLKSMPQNFKRFWSFDKGRSYYLKEWKVEQGWDTGHENASLNTDVSVCKRRLTARQKMGQLTVPRTSCLFLACRRLRTRTWSKAVCRKHDLVALKIFCASSASRGRDRGTWALRFKALSKSPEIFSKWCLDSFAFFISLQHSIK